MLHILYGLVCCKNVVGDEVCRTVKKVENYCSKYCSTVAHRFSNCGMRKTTWWYAEGRFWLETHSIN
jgi:hypothetical protein